MDSKTTTLAGPAWGAYEDPDEAYIRGQAGSLGSGLLCGWAESNLGGPFGTGESSAVAEVLRDLKEARRAREREHDPTVPAR